MGSAMSEEEVAAVLVAFAGALRRALPPATLDLPSLAIALDDTKNRMNNSRPRSCIALSSVMLEAMLADERGD